MRSLSVTATGVNKAYDGTTSATVTLSDNRVAGDSLTTSYSSASFADKNVGTAKTVSISGIAVSGTDAGNYSANTTATTTANITARVLTVTATGANKVYNGTTNATVILADNRLAGDSLSTSYTSASFASKNVGTARTVTVSGISLSGADAANYIANTTASATANITVRALTVSATGVTRVYDGTTTATVTLSDDRVAGDSLSTSYTSASFTSKNVGTSKNVIISGIAVTGADAANYTANSTTSTTADITARALVVSATGLSKVYDGTTVATVTLSDNRVAGDSLTTSYTGAAFVNAYVGTAKSISVSGIAIGGADAPNYTANASASASANITAATLTGEVSVNNKVYDGTTAATIATRTLYSVVGSDNVTLTGGTANFANKNTGTAKTVTATGLSLSGTAAGNYQLASTSATTTANITVRSLSVSAAGVNKAYDGTSTATVTLSDNRVTGDSLTTSYSGASFANKNAGTAKPISISGITVSGTDAGNYSANSTASTTADISARALSVTATGSNKVYDGTTSATVTLADNRLTGDSVSPSYTSASFASKNVGNAKSIAVSGISLTGADAANYSANTTATTTADISTKRLTVSGVTADNKAYDGTTAATLSTNDVAFDAVIGADVVGLVTNGYTATFASPEIGTNIAVTVSGLTLGGSDTTNYTLEQPTDLTANITASALTVTGITANDKTYDGTTTATLNLGGATLNGVASGDAVTLNTGGAGGAFADAHVGTGKTVTVSGLALTGPNAGNYTLTQPATTANITTAALTPAIAAASRAYDGTTAATITTRTISGVLGSDDVSLIGGTASFADKNVGVGKTVTATGLQLSGADAANYTTITTASTTAEITARALVISAAGVNKVYDGTSTATVTFSDDRVAGDSLSTSYTSADFANKNVGAGKTVNVSGITVSGTDAANYSGQYDRDHNCGHHWTHAGDRRDRSEQSL